MTVMNSQYGAPIRKRSKIGRPAVLSAASLWHRLRRLAGAHAFLTQRAPQPLGTRYATSFDFDVVIEHGDAGWFVADLSRPGHLLGAYRSPWWAAIARRAYVTPEYWEWLIHPDDGGLISGFMVLGPPPRLCSCERAILILQGRLYTSYALASAALDDRLNVKNERRWWSIVGVRRAPRPCTHAQGSPLTLARAAKARFNRDVRVAGCPLKVQLPRAAPVMSANLAPGRRRRAGWSHTNVRSSATRIAERRRCLRRAAGR